MTRTAFWAMLATAALARADVAFSDGTFSPADWQIVQFTNGAGGAYAAIQQPAGGNPGAFRRIDITVNAVNSSLPSQIWGAQFKAGAVYDFRALGAIASIDYSEDHINIARIAAGDGQGTGLAIRQNNRVYVATTVTGQQTSWQHLSMGGLKAGDFGLLTGDTQFYDGATHPDFSAAAAQIELGFWRGNTSKGGAYSTSVGIDNWAVVIHTAPPATSSNAPNSGQVGDPVSTATGEYFESNEQLNLGGPLPLRFKLYYASYLGGAGVTSALGNNWMHNFDVTLQTTPTDAIVTLDRGKAVRFTRSGSGWQLAGNEPLAHQLVSTSSGYSFLDLGENLIYNFTGSGALASVADRNGNTLTVTRAVASPGPDQVSDGLGRSLTFVYSEGKLTRVQDQTGRSLTFTYTGNDLTAFTDANGKTTRYSYAGPGQFLSKTLPSGDVSVNNIFDAQGRVVRQTDALGNATAIAYNAGNTSVTDALANTLQHIHGGAANLTGYIDPAGQGVVLGYDSASRLSVITDRLGDKTSYTWHNPSGFVASYSDAAGSVTSYSYTPQTQSGFTFYNVTGITYADGSSVHLTYDAAGNVLSAMDQAGKTWKYAYNSRGQLTFSTNPANAVTTYSYNADATMASVRLASGDTTAFSYDNKKRLRAIRYGDGTSRTFAYDDRDRIVEKSNASGNKTALAYNDNGRLVSVSDAVGATSKLAYDANQRPVAFTAANGNTTRLQADAVGRVQTLTAPTGESAQLAFDALNRLTAITDASGKGISFAYDKEGVLNAIADGAGQTWSLGSSKTGRITGITSPLGRTFTFAYDLMGRLASMTDPLGQTTGYARDGRGLLTGVLLPGGIGAAFARNDLGQLTAVTDPNGNVWQQVFNAEGKLTSEADPLGRARSYMYGPRNRIRQINTGEGSVAFTYDGAGNLVRRLYSDGTDLKFAYDAAGHTVAANGVTLGFDAPGAIISSNGLTIARDDSGRISAIVYGDGKTVTYSYDGRGLLSQVADWAGAVTQFAYDDVRRLASITRPNGIVTLYSYDLDGRLSGIAEALNGTPFSAIELQRDAVGNVVSAQRDVPLEPNPAPGVAPFGYDAAGQVSGATYDSMGRPTSLRLLALTWDLASRLVSYSGPNGADSFTYDAYGMRIASSTRGYIWNYAFAVPRMSIVRDASGDLRYYVWLPDGSLLASIEASDNSHRYFHFDEIGNTVFLSDDSGAATDSYGITPYGEQVDHNGTSDNPLTFMGQWGVMQEGATGLFYMGFRYYDSATARFLTREPRPSLDPRALSSYQYAFGNPLSYIDPLGRGHIGRHETRAESDFGKFVLELPGLLTTLRTPNELLAPKLGTGILNYLHGPDTRKEADR